MKKKINKGYKFRLYPDKSQLAFLNQNIGNCRFIYNHFQDKQEKDKIILFTKMEKELLPLKEQYDWLKLSNSQSLQYAVRNLDSGNKRYFKHIAKRPVKHYKSDGGSFTIPQHFKLLTIDNKKFGYIQIPKLETALKFRKHRNIIGRILLITILLDATGKYYISFVTEQEIEIKNNEKEKIVGIDLNLMNLATTSDGKVYDSKKILKNKEKKLKRLQRWKDRKKKGSKNRKKAKKKLAIQHKRVSNVRKDYLHKVSNEIVKSHDVIITEDLQVKNMVKNGKLSKAISNQGWGYLNTMLKYKADWAGKVYHQINRWYSSSKICNHCRYINKNLTLDMREFNCQGCRELLDRDYNASCNIRDEGLREINTVGNTGINACGEVKVAEYTNLYSSVNLDEARSPFL